MHMHIAVYYVLCGGIKDNTVAGIETHYCVAKGLKEGKVPASQQDFDFILLLISFRTVKTS